jgi:A/G-specific adenine glycosylase
VARPRAAGSVPPVHEALLQWYAAVRRDLMWRRTRDPYAILVSEVMLQQTQVARVVPRYEAWLERWPTAGALAAAPLAEVLAAWVGLGYNRRAVRLWEACRQVADEGWPRTAAGLRALPGVGPYTAAAVASFAFGEAVACVDTNVARVAGRLGRATPDELLAGAPPGAAPTWNQAMMELGATVCRARDARCGACPVAPWCASRGAVAVAPRAAAGTQTPFEETNRWARGRIVAALAAGEGLPGDLPAERLERALEGLVRDGLVRRRGTGFALG